MSKEKEKAISPIISDFRAKVYEAVVYGGGKTKEKIETAHSNFIATLTAAINSGEVSLEDVVQALANQLQTSSREFARNQSYDSGYSSDE